VLIEIHILYLNRVQFGYPSHAPSGCLHSVLLYLCTTARNHSNAAVARHHRALVSFRFHFSLWYVLVFPSHNHNFNLPKIIGECAVAVQSRNLGKNAGAGTQNVAVKRRGEPAWQQQGAAADTIHADVKPHCGQNACQHCTGTTSGTARDSPTSWLRPSQGWP